MKTKKLPYRLISLFIAFIFLLSGCATRVPNVGQSTYYQQCVNPFVEMQKKDNEVAQKTAMGALGGALAGAIIGVLASGNWGGALIGLGIGALGVGAITYTFTKMDQVADENTRFASIRVTANQDLHKATRLQLYSYESMNCYAGEFDKLQDSYESGLLTKDEYSKRFREIHRAMTALGEVIGNMEADIERTEREFNASFAKVPSAPQAPEKTPELQDPTDEPDDEPTPQIATKPAHKKTPPAVQPAPAHATRKAGKRIGKRISAVVAKNKNRVRRTQAKNDDDLSKILDDFAGKVKPPPQNKQAIKQEYGQSYTQTRRQMKDLRAVHREALDIMHSAAKEAGIDMI